MEGPQRLADSYRQALGEGRLDDAYRLTSRDYQLKVTRQEFEAQYADAGIRQRRAAEIASATADLRIPVAELELVLEQGHWRLADWGLDRGPRAALSEFLHDVNRGDFEAAYRLLSARWKSQYTPDRFRRDFEAEPRAPELLTRAAAALKEKPQRVDDRLEYPVGEGKSVQLVREHGAYRIAALE